MDFQADLYRRAGTAPARVILPETGDIRVLQAADRVLKQGFALPVLLGDRDELEKRARVNNLSLKGAAFRAVTGAPDQDDFVKRLVALRAHRGMTEELARQKMADPLWFGAMMVKTGQADGLVAGSIASSADVFHAALQIIGPRPGIEVVSVAGFIEIPDKTRGEEGMFLFADCVVTENPTTSQLASIALSSADTWKTLLNTEPRAALLSYSTKGSADSPYTRKVREAADRVKAGNPSLICDGELQLDAAIIPEVARKKAPSSPVEGRANILIFPDLNSANTNFKNTERLGGGLFRASVVQGLALPINDLSRGTSVETIVDTVAVTVLQSRERYE
ncbi:MAG: phosphate acetyltransferase [Spirochaetales bacterium]|nr:phosphate acetyltransferase [Spirochaetales bacterium]